MPEESNEKNQSMTEAIAVKTDTNGYMNRKAIRHAMYPADDLSGACFGMIAIQTNNLPQP